MKADERRAFARSALMWAACAFLLVSPLGGLLSVEAEEARRFTPPSLQWLQRVGWRLPLQDTLIVGVSDDLLGLDLSLDAENVGATRARFISRPDPVVARGHDYSYRPAIDGAQSVQYELEGAPAGLSVDATTGEVRGVPSSSGRYRVVVRAVLSEGGRLEQAFQLDVVDSGFLLGTDSQGRDVLRRVLSSGPHALPPSLLAMLVSLLVGGGWGAIAGYRGGTVDALLQRATPILQGLPPLLMAFLTAAITDLSLAATMVVVGLFLMPETADGVRQRVRALRERDFVEACRELGLPERTILWREIIWLNCRTFLLTRASQATIYGLLTGVTVAYIGLVDPGSPHLGAMLKDGLSWLYDYPLLFAVPAAWIVILVTAIRVAEAGVARRWRTVP